MQLPIYLDNNATTPVDDRVLDRMLPFFREHYGNASSAGHPFGWTADEAVDQAREQVAESIGAAPREITFTSGATEALNLALKGVAEAYARKGQHVVTVQTEHKAVLDACQALERSGVEVTYLPVDADGRLDLDALEAALTDETILVAVMWANNETGVLQPIPEIYERVRDRGSLFLTDTTQALGKTPVSAEHADLLVGSAHKIYGPKGVGFLYHSKRRPRVRLVPQVDGGGQEDGLRGGTLNVPGIVGLGAAATLARDDQADDAERLEPLRDAFEARLVEALPDVQINGRPAPRLPNTANVTFRGAPADKLMLALRDLAVSTGSACSSDSNKPSHVLTAMGVPADDARSTIRFSLGRFTTAEQMEHAAAHVIDAVTSLRGDAVLHS
ncbi:MAG: aminotransferase class V-fold PLP-dependent enzyme [Bacteroidetes bacterium]|jgi:cysteine desulfurase|nr:aminotransferase class V-fold PLP-dependent enzyme [Bacteroidota bacterium]